MNIEPSPTSPKAKKPPQTTKKRIKKIFYISTLSIIFGFLAGLLGEITLNTYLTTPFRLPILGEIQIIDPYSLDRELIIRQETNGDGRIRTEKIISLTPSLVSIYETKAPTEESAAEPLYFPNEEKGQGIFVTNDGWIVTDRMVSENRENLTVINDQGETSQVQKIVTDPASDFVFLKTDLSSSHVATLIKPENLELGQNIHLLNVFNSQLNRSINVQHSTLTGFDSSFWTQALQSSDHFNNFWLLTDNVSALPAGTAIFTDQGQLIGLLHEISLEYPTKLIQPTDRIDALIKQLPNQNNVSRPRLGVTYLSALDKDFLKSDNIGALITGSTSDETGIEPGSAAEKAGLNLGDLIIKINNQTLDQKTTLTDLIQNYAPNQVITVTIERKKEIKELTVTLKNQ